MKTTTEQINQRKNENVVFQFDEFIQKKQTKMIKALLI